MRRRYESWFLRLGLADGSGAWWIRYLLTSPGRASSQHAPLASPCQVWATWFPQNDVPESYIQHFPLEALKLQPTEPFVEIGPNRLYDDHCHGAIEAGGKKLSWNLRYHSTFRTTISHKGWIGFSRTPHSDAVFSGEIMLGDKVFRGDHLGVGLQGHNCGFRHRHFWTWMHASFPQNDGTLSTFEALIYEMPFGLVFRKALLWHRGQPILFRKLIESRRDRQHMQWGFLATSRSAKLEITIDGAAGVHRLPYTKTDYSGTFEVANNSRAGARIELKLKNSASAEQFLTESNAVLEMAGDYVV